LLNLPVQNLGQFAPEQLIHKLLQRLTLILARVKYHHSTPRIVHEPGFMNLLYRQAFQ
jgi:hypothetical protein